MPLTEENPVWKILQEFLNNPGAILKIQRLSKSQLKVQNPYDHNGVKISKSQILLSPPDCFLCLCWSRASCPQHVLIKMSTLCESNVRLWGLRKPTCATYTEKSVMSFSPWALRRNPCNPELWSYDISSRVLYPGSITLYQLQGINEDWTIHTISVLGQR